MKKKILKVSHEKNVIKKIAMKKKNIKSWDSHETDVIKKLAIKNTIMKKIAMKNYYEKDSH